MRSFLRKGIALAASTLLSLSIPVFAVNAEENTRDDVKIFKHEGVTYRSTVTEREVTVDIQVDETTTTDSIVINPFYGLENEVIYVQPGDKVNYKIHVTDGSKMNYEFLDGSLNITANIPNTEDGPAQKHCRPLNNALVDLGLVDKLPTYGLGQSDLDRALTDAKIGAKLKNISNLVSEEDANLDAKEITKKYLGEYYLWYYNNTVNLSEPVDSIAELPDSYIIDLFNGYTDFISTEPKNTTLSETCSEVKQMHYRYVALKGVTLDGTGILQYTRGSEPVKTLEGRLKSAYNTENAVNCLYALDGFSLDNSYQNTKMDWGLSFTLVKPGYEPDKKISEPDLVKKITDGDKIDIDNEERPGDYATVDAAGRVGFTLTSHVGEDLAEVIKKLEAADPGTEMGDPDALYDTSGSYTFTFVDHLDNDLALDKESIAVTVNGKPVTIPAESIVVTPVTDGKYEGRNQIRVSFDLVGLFKDDFFEYEEFGKAPIVMTYSATVKNADEVVPGKMYNTAWVEYREKQTLPDDVDVDTFGVKVFKYDQTTNKGLAGAKFDLYVVNEDGSETCVKKDAESNAEGYVEFKGLKEGNYKLVETVAPEGYTKSDKALPITVNKDKDDDNYYVVTQFANVPEVHTGGTGTMLFSIGGGALLVAGAAYYMISKKRQAE